MTPLELRLIAYAISALLCFGVVAWGVHTLDARHYERIAQAEKLAQDLALEQAQRNVIAAQALQQAVAQAAEKQYETLKATSDGLSQRLSDSVSGYSALSRGLVSATSTAAAIADAARQGPQRDRELAELVRQATFACEGDAAQLTALQTWATEVSKPNQIALSIETR